MRYAVVSLLYLALLGAQRVPWFPPGPIALHKKDWLRPAQAPRICLSGCPHPLSPFPLLPSPFSILPSPFMVPCSLLSFPLSLSLSLSLPLPAAYGSA